MTQDQTAQAQQDVTAQAQQNEVVAAGTDASALVTTVSSTPKQGYDIVQTADGKFQRKAVYEFYASIHPESREQKIAMLNLLDSNDGALPLGDNVGVEFSIVDVIFNPYDSIDESTGEIVNGVLTYMFTPDNKVYVTSSKSVHFTLKNAFKVFGEPHYTNDEALKVKVVKKKGRDHDYTDLTIIG